MGRPAVPGIVLIHNPIDHTQGVRPETVNISREGFGPCFSHPAPDKLTVVAVVTYLVYSAIYFFSRNSSTAHMDVPIFASLGTRTGRIEVVLDRWLMRWFCEGPHAGPYKAIQELAANSFDAGARRVAVCISKDNGTIAVIDDGSGMDASGLQQHWQTGTSDKGQLANAFASRVKMGRHGIGKLASSALAERLTHITKKNGTILSASVAYGASNAPIPKDHKDRMTVPLYELNEADTERALAHWIECPALRASHICLWGDCALRSWTVSILSSLRAVASDLKPEVLEWFLLGTLPLSDDFRLWVTDGQRLEQI